MTRRSVLIMLAGAIGVAASPEARSQPAAATTVVLVRHAEAVSDAGRDPGLSEAGIARASALAGALKDAGVAAVFTTQYQRTILTGGPVATAMKAPAVQSDIGAGPAGLDAYVRQVVQTVHAKYGGRTVLIVGHSNTIPALVKAFSGIDPGEIAHDSYGQMFIVTTNAPGTGRLVRARYGPS